MTPAPVTAAARAAGTAWAAETAASIPAASAAPSPAETEGRRALPGKEVAAGCGGSLDPSGAAGHA
jgi:hypothetical protein